MADFIDRMLDWIEEYEKAATAGPWVDGYNEIRGPQDESRPYYYDRNTVVALEYGYYDSCDLKWSDEDKRFMIEARTDLPHLTAALRVAVKALRDGGDSKAALKEIEGIIKRDKKTTPA